MIEVIFVVFSTMVTMLLSDPFAVFAPVMTAAAQPDRRRTKALARTEERRREVGFFTDALWLIGREIPVTN